MKKAPVLLVEEIGGDQYPNIDAAQDAALSTVAANLQAVIRDLLECGALLNVDGKIIPGPQR